MRRSVDHENVHPQADVTVFFQKTDHKMVATMRMTISTS